MSIFGREASNLLIYNKHSVNQLRGADKRTWIGLISCKLLLIFAIVLILLNNIDLISPGDYFGAYNWITITIFAIGLVINSVAIPYLYFSSFKNFKGENEVWDQETFWILPLFFFGTFFIYESHFPFSEYVLIATVTAIAILHISYVISARKMVIMTPGKILANYQQYSMSLKYLSVYYFLLLIVLYNYNPLRRVIFLIHEYSLIG